MIARKPMMWALYGAAAGALCVAIGPAWTNAPAPSTSQVIWSGTSGAPGILKSGVDLSRVVWSDLLPEAARGADAVKPGDRTPPPARPNAVRRQQIQEYLRHQAMTPQERQQDAEAQKQNEAAEWSKFMDFFRENSPTRYGVISQRMLPPNAPQRINLMTRWLNMQQMKADQPELYQQHVLQFQEEDKLFRLAGQLRMAHKNQNAMRADSLKEQIGLESRKLVDIHLTERKLQIQHAQHLLNQEMAKLTVDENSRDQLAQQQQQQVVQAAVSNNPQANPVPGDGGAPEPAPGEAPVGLHAFQMKFN